VDDGARTIELGAVRDFRGFVREGPESTRLFGRHGIWVFDPIFSAPRSRFGSTPPPRHPTYKSTTQQTDRRLFGRADRYRDTNEIRGRFSTIAGKLSKPSIGVR